MKQIKNGEYIDFGALLFPIIPTAASMASIAEGEDSEEYCLSQRQEPGSSARFIKKSARSPITNYATWVLAWNMFYEATLYHFPLMHYELFSYFKHIAEFAPNRKFEYLAAYDKTHRMHIAAQRDLPEIKRTSWWTKHDPSLYNTYLRDNMKAHCQKCLGYGHYEKQCAQASDNQTGNTQAANPSPQPTNNNYHNYNTPPTQSQPSQFRNGQNQRNGGRQSNNTNLINVNPSSNTRKYCFRFNRGESCRLPCDWPHLCYWCHKPHPDTRCPEKLHNNNQTSTGFRP